MLLIRNLYELLFERALRDCPSRKRSENRPTNDNASNTATALQMIGKCAVCTSFNEEI